MRTSLVNMFARLSGSMRPWGKLLPSGVATAMLVLTGPAAAGPAPGVSCIASAQNRSTPLTASGDYVLENLPGSGIAPFGVGAHAQPFRVRVTCDDGTVGETPLTFPAFEQQLITPDPIVWGQKTPVPSSLRLEFSKSVIGPDAQLRGSTTARYPDGSEKSVTARASGTGYRSSAAGFVGVDDEGKVFLQSSSFQTFASMMPIPAFVTITAENDGVTTSRMLKLVGPAQLIGRVSQADGSSAGNLEVRLSIPGHEDKLVRTEASGNFRFTDLPFLASRSGQVTVVDRVKRRAASSAFYFDHQGGVAPGQLQLQLNGGTGLVRVRVVDAAGAAQPGVEVGVSDAYARAVEGGSLPLQRTDSNGDAFFDQVNAGQVSVLSGSAGYVAEPGVAYLSAGSFLPFVLRGGGASPALAATLVGDVQQLPNRAPAVGVSVELMRDGTGAPLRQIVDGSGSYAFRGLAANSSYRLLLKLGTELVRETWIYTSGPGGERRQDFLLDPQLGMLGQVFAKDGVTAVAGATLQLSWYDESLRTWRIAATGSSRADGAFGWRYLGARAYRLEAVTSDGASGRIDVDLSAAAPGTLQNVRIQLNDKIVQTRLGLRATVMGAANFGALDAQLFVKNSVCPSACAVGLLRSTGDRLETDLLPQGSNEFELRWKGRVQAFTIEVNSASDGQTLERLVDFPAEASGTQRITQQRSLFSFEAAAGEAMDATVLGMESEGTPAARAVKLELYGPDGAKLGEGRGFDPAYNAAPAAQALRGLFARASGRHTLIVSPLTPDAVNLGSYGMLITVAGRATLAQAWTAVAPARFGAQAAGRVFQRNGAPAAGRPVLVRAGVADQIQLVEQIVADVDGNFEHQNLPLGPVHLSVHDEAGLTLAKAQGSLDADGERLLRDLQLSARTTLALNLRLSDALLGDGPIGAVPLELVDELNQRRVDLLFEPAAVTATVETAVIGDRGTVKLVHPRNARIVAEREIVGDDGARIELDLALPTGGVTGRVMSATGDPVPASEVAAFDTEGRLLDQAVVDAEARFLFKVLPADANVRLLARDRALEIEVASELIVREGVQLTAVDLVLPTAAIGGEVLFQNGSPVAGANVEASFGTASSFQAMTDAQGRYEFRRVPAERPVTIRALHPANGQPVAVQAQGQRGEFVEAPQIYFEIVGASVQGRVRNLSGRALEGIQIVVANNGERASCTNWDDGSWPIPSRARARTAKVGGALTDGGEFSTRGVTDAEGRFLIPNVQSGPMVVSAAMGLICQVQEREIEVGAAGSSAQAGEFVFPDMGSVLLRIVDPAGQPIDVPNRYGGECPVRLTVSGPGIDQVSLPVPPLGGVRVEGVPFGTYTAELHECSDFLGRGQIEVKDSNPSNFDIVIPILKGRVSYADGSTLSYGYVSLRQRDAQGVWREVSSSLDGYDPFGNPKEPGTYYLFGGFTTGAYELWLRDHDSGVQRRWTGVFSQLPTEALNLSLPNMAQLQGCVTQADGIPAAPTHVRIFNEDLVGGYSVIGSREVTANGGCYRFDRAPAGDTVLHVFQGEELKAVQTFSLAPLSDKALVQRNVQYPTQGRAVVQAVNAQGQAMYNQRLILQPQQIEQALSYNDKEARSAGNGYATFNLMPGPYTANQLGSWWNDPSLGRSSLRVSAGSTVEAAVPNANSYKFGGTHDAPTVPEATAGFMFDEAGRLVSAGQVGHFNSWNGPQLLINGLPMPRSLGMDYQIGAREMAMGPFEYGNRLSIKRRLFVPAVGGYARQIETLTNGSAQTVTVRVEIAAQGDSYCDADRITEPQNSPERGYVAYEDCQVAGAHVYNGIASAAAVVKPSRVDLRSVRGRVTQWMLTLAPGQSAAIMHFHVLTPTADAAALALRADGLARLAEPGMLEGLSAEDRQNIRNFAIGQ
ncbi:carboxypeptidase-like regulatory domain-containing protein [Kinneretia aquatilis]|nr:carboxypeptidase-like regulatory domain-containing protein [Paucibacter aquatile]